MKKTVTITWFVLIFITIVSALVSKLESKYVVLLILIFSALKFFGIAYQFMEIKKAHLLWKTLIVGFVLLFGIGLLATI